MAAPCREVSGLRRATAAAAWPPVSGRRGENELCLAPFHHRAPRQQQQGRRSQLRRGVKAVAAISEDLPRLAAPRKKGAAEGGGQPEEVLMQAALTVRRKQKEDLKEALAGHLDALRDMVGLNVALELISTKIHPSKHKHCAAPILPLACSSSNSPFFPHWDQYPSELTLLSQVSSLNLSELSEFFSLSYDRCKSYRELDMQSSCLFWAAPSVLDRDR